MVIREATASDSTFRIPSRAPSTKMVISEEIYRQEQSTYIDNKTVFAAGKATLIAQEMEKWMEKWGQSQVLTLRN